MSLRNMFRIDSSLQSRRWQMPIVLPVVLALALVIALAIQSIRATQMHRRAVANALRDYASFATWQYTRRASDYLRLTIGAQLTMRAFQLPGALDAQSRVNCRFRGGAPAATQNETSSPTTTIEEGLAEAIRRADASHQLIGILPFGDAHRPQYLGYRFQRDSAGWSACEVMVVDASALLPVFNHVAGYAPLLPPTFVANLPNDSLVSIQVFDPRGERIAAIGTQTPGMSATDVLGPDLADLKVVATLHPAATERLVAGGMPASNAPALIAMLVVAGMLCGVAVVQLRKTHEVIRLRDDFVASVSHELKTPLTQISLFADTLASPRERSPEERRRYLTIISREAARLGHLVDGILHFAGMTRSSSAATHREASLVGEEIRAAISAFEPLADARNVSIHLRVDHEVELPLDRDAFRQVMLNVLDNALKFGPDGQQILIRVASGGENAAITVDDEGPGVPGAERERAFEAFVRTQTAGNKTGSGIGLAVVREVVRRHGGKAWLDASPSGGARVEIRLPATRVVTAELCHDGRMIDTSAKILVVEDNKDLALGLRVNLEERRYQVQVSPTVSDGLARLRSYRPDLMILDLGLPDGDGLGLIRRLRGDGDNTLILVLTAKAQQDSKVIGLRVGADDYVTKPFDLEELMARVEVLLRRSRPTDAPALPSIPADLAVIGSTEVDVRARVLRRDGESLVVSRIGFELLLALLRRRGAVVSRAELMREVWGYSEDVVSRTLDTHIFELRQLVEPDPSAPVHIRTVWRIGYRLE